MSHPMANERVQPCIWMSAGLLSYKLCDRDFECEHCPLDAALRGQAVSMPRHPTLWSPTELAGLFPEDRLYSPGHSWVQSIGSGDDRLFRFGLDAFAATMIGSCRGVSCTEPGRERARGEVLCEIDLGLGRLFLTAPIGSETVARNRKLESEPNCLVTAPYGDGWIANLLARDVSQLGKLLTAHRARDRTRLDLRRFRRRIALQLLADTDSLGPCLPDGGELADLRQILAGPAYLDLVREMIR